MQAKPGVALETGLHMQQKVPQMKKKNDFKLPMEQKLLVGAVAGVVGTSCIFPLDMVKTRLQAAGQAGATVKYNGVLDCIRQMYAKEGVRGFYRGLAANLTGVTPEKAIKLAVNEKMRETLEDANGEISLPNQVLAGGTAGFCQVVATNPMEIVKLRVQLQATLPAAERRGTIEIVKRLGLKGMYRGAPATWARDIPYSMIFFPAYANVKEWLTDPETGETNIVKNLAAGATAGALAAGLMTPMDVVKTRFQQQGGKQKYGNLVNCAKVTMQNEGPFAFYKGAVPRMATQGPLFGIALAAFELQKWYMVKYQQ